MKQQLHTKEQIKQLKSLNYKIKKLKKEHTINVPSVAEETNTLMTGIEYAKAEKQEILSLKP